MTLDDAIDVFGLHETLTNDDIRYSVETTFESEVMDVAEHIGE